MNPSSALKIHHFAVGDRVRYKRWTGRIYKVQSDGGLLIDFTACAPPIPFFRGPYWPKELEHD